jgi:hypothetical protein
MVVAIDRLGRECRRGRCPGSVDAVNGESVATVAATLGVSRAAGEVDLLWVGGEKRFVVQIGSEFLDVEGTMKSGT